MLENANDILNGDVLEEKDGRQWYHFDEFKTNWYLTIFYRIETVNDEKQLTLEFITMPNYIEAGYDSLIQYFEYDKVFNFLDRNKYANVISLKIPAEYEYLLNEDYDYASSSCELKDFLKHNPYEKLVQLTNNPQRKSKCSCESAFYQNDYMLFNLGAGRTEQSILELTADTPDGYYFCNELTYSYNYDTEKAHTIKFLEDYVEDMLINMFNQNS